MPTWLILYELGIRIAQALEVFPDAREEEGTIPYAFRNLTLTRLEIALGRLPNNTAVTRTCSRLMGDMLSVFARLNVETYAEVRTQLIALREVIEQWTANDGVSREERLWLQVGLEMANGDGEPASDGRPTQTSDHRLAFVDPRDATWSWRNRRRLDHLLAELRRNDGELFPSKPTLSDHDFEQFPMLPEWLWGWAAIESGLRQLRLEAGETGTDEPGRRRRGRPRDASLIERDRLIVQAHAENPRLSHTKLDELLKKRHPEHKFSPTIVRRAIKSCRGS